MFTSACARVHGADRESSPDCKWVVQSAPRPGWLAGRCHGSGRWRGRDLPHAARCSEWCGQRPVWFYTIYSYNYCTNSPPPHRSPPISQMKTWKTDVHGQTYNRWCSQESACKSKRKGVFVAGMAKERRSRETHRERERIWAKETVQSDCSCPHYFIFSYKLHWLPCSDKYLIGICCFICMLYNLGSIQPQHGSGCCTSRALSPTLPLFSQRFL